MRKFVVLLILLALAAAPAQALISGYDPRYISIDGNITPGDGGCDPGDSPCIDWLDKLNDGSLSPVVDGWGNNDGTILSPGSTLNSGSTLAKEDVTRVWMSNNNKYLYIAEERLANNGNSAWHLFFTRIQPTYNQGEPVIYHLQNGDLEVQICLPKGSDPTSKSITVRRVMGVSGILDVPVVDIWSTGVLQATESNVVAAFEINTIPTLALDGAHDSKGNETSTYDTACFAEAAISLQLLGLDPCGSRAYASVVTRSSCSLTSDLKDFAEPVLYSFGGPMPDPIEWSVDCNGNGEFSVNFTGGIAPYSIQWYKDNEAISGATEQSLSLELAPGDHVISVVITDSAGCAAAADTGSFTVYAPINVSPITKSLDCTDRGCFSVAISGGTKPYGIQWYDNGTLLPDFTGASFCTVMTPGTHNVKVVVTDTKGCIQEQETGEFTVYPILAVSPVTKTLDCQRKVDCSVTVTGGAEPVMIQWYDNGVPIPGATGPSFSKVFEPGTHNVSVVVTDAVGCKQERETGEFTVYPDLTVSEIDKSQDCSTNVCLSVTISGGAPAYTIKWYDNGTALDGVSEDSFCKAFDPGTHNVKVVVTDSRGCSVEKETGEFTVNPILDLSEITKSVDCDNNGCFSITVTGGAEPYTYEWYDNEAPLDDVTGNSFCKILTAGTHNVKVIVTDAAGCTGQKETGEFTVYELLELSQITKSLDCTNKGCFSVTISGGAEPYTIQWYDNGTLLPDFTGASFCTVMTPGTHNVKVVVTDSKGCSREQATGEFPVYPILVVSPITWTVDCQRKVDCSVTVTGGAEPVMIQWYDNGVPIPGATGPSFSKVFEPGTHNVSVVVTDAAGCQQEKETGEFTVYPNLTVSEIDKSQDCSTNVCLSVTISGGAPPYAVEWYDNGTLLPDFTEPSFCKALDPGTHNAKVVVTDSRGCSVEKETGEFTVNPVLALSDITKSVDCSNNGCFSITVTGGAEPHAYEWYDNDVLIPDITTSSFCKDLTPGTHNLKVIVTDAAGCTGQKDTGGFNVIPVLSISPVTKTVDCERNVCCSVTVTGGAEPYTYQWYDNDTLIPDATNDSFCKTLDEGAHKIRVVVTDAPGCSGQSETEAFPVYPILDVQLAANGDCSGCVVWTATASGGDENYSYEWSVDGVPVVGAGATLEYALAADCKAHVVSVTVADGRGCKATAKKQITQTVNTVIE